jgi:hypothetical protein
VSSASRCASVSPTQRIGSNPAASAAGILRATPRLVEALATSEWPRITASTPTSRSIGAETSPVKAPAASSCMFWAPTRTLLWAQCSTADLSATNEGQTTTSGPPLATLGRKSPRKASASSIVLFIFQFAAM